MSKNNVYPDHYKVAGRDRQDDAAAARQTRSIAAKPSSQQRPDRMGKAFYFERTEPAPPASARRPEERAEKQTSKKSGTRKASAPRRKPTPRKTASGRRTTGRTAKPGTAKK